jgi:heme/copper-type cytochrome/quinol oxidase subunit 2
MKKMKNLFFVIVIILLLLPFGILHADHGGPHPLGNPLEGTANTIPEFIDKILEMVVTIGGPIVVFFIIYSGFLFVVARGNPEKISTAKTTLFWTIIGAVIVLGALVISTAISGTIDQITDGLNG